MQKKKIKCFPKMFISISCSSGASSLGMNSIFSGSSTLSMVFIKICYLALLLLRVRRLDPSFLGLYSPSFSRFSRFWELPMDSSLSISSNSWKDFNLILKIELSEAKVNDLRSLGSFSAPRSRVHYFFSSAIGRELSFFFSLGRSVDCLHSKESFCLGIEFSILLPLERLGNS